MKAFWVSHTHWDREWYRSFEEFRARLVDTIDCVLDRVEHDAGFRFLLDGQTVVLEDYLAVRPGQREALLDACRSGRIAIGPWYVQPDSFLPCGEAHLRNLLAGRRTALDYGGASEVAYTPDSFGHPAQFPQLFTGFGLKAFVYWRGNGGEVDHLPSEYRWAAPDGSTMTACLLRKGYFGAALLPRDVSVAVPRIAALAQEIAEDTRQDAIVLMNGIDHTPPDPLDREISEGLAAATDLDVRRGLLDDFVAELGGEMPTFRGELRGARIANLLPGVWSARMPLKLRNRACERELTGNAEPWAALAGFYGLPDERPALDLAWRATLLNQAHDSIGGCSIDSVHRQMEPRFDEAFELARETARRCKERLAGLPLERETPVREPLEIAVFNPSPHTRTDVLRFALDASPSMPLGAEGVSYHPVLAANRSDVGYAAEGMPARMVRGTADGRFFFDAEKVAMDVEFVARDVPAFGWKRIQLTPCEPVEEILDNGREIEVGSIRVRVEEDGTLCVCFGEREYTGILGIEDLGDRGDSYDADLLEDGDLWRLESIDHVRKRHASGIQHLEIHRVLRLPARLNEARDARVGEASFTLIAGVRIVPGVERVDIGFRVENSAEDHRLRLLFPTGCETVTFEAASTFDAMERSVEPQDSEGWIHGAPRTFPIQGWVSLGGLTVVAPGLPEAEVGADGTLALTLLRSVGWLSRPDLRTRPGPAGPTIPAREAQCKQPFDARISLQPTTYAAAARDAEVGLRVVSAGEEPLVEEGRALLEVEPRELQFSALKPVEEGRGAVLRLLNPTDESMEARVTLGMPFSDVELVNLDETPTALEVERAGNEVRFEVPAKALRSLRILGP